MVAELDAEKLRRICDPQALGFQASDEMAGLEALIGQERALRALRFGPGIQELGFNIYVSGLPGTGRTTAVRREQILHSFQQQRDEIIARVNQQAEREGFVYMYSF